MGEIDLSTRFPSMRPVTKAPTMWMVNGIGTSVYGKRDPDAETGAYITTLCFCILFIPIVFLRAYRVVPSPNGGWYFLGTEPMSKLTKGWNVVLLVAIISACVAIPVGAYFGSAEYQEKRQFAQAQSLVQQGDLQRGSMQLETLALNGGVTSADAARELRKLAETNFTVANAAQAAPVFSSLAKVSQQTGDPQAAALVERGLKTAATLADIDPKESLALLSIMRKLVVDPREIDAARFPILQKWVAKAPDEMTPAIQLAELLDAQQKTVEAKKLLEPFKSKLGNGEGARILGSIYMHEGDDRAAYELLKPYVQPRLVTFHAAEKAYDETSQQLVSRELDRLKNNQGPREFYRKYETASEDQRDAMVREYINTRTMNDAHLRRAQENLQKESDIVPVAMELGIVMLGRAQGIADPAARKKELEATQEVFLAIQGAAGESDEYRLFLGQVKYWLGKQDEGKKLFDEFLLSKARSTQALLQLSMAYRNLGSDPESRRLSEEAYNKAANNDDRYSAARIRSLAHTDIEDRIAWLQRDNVNEPSVKADLSMARGYQAFEAGRDAEAIGQFKEAVAAYAAMPKSETVYNDMGLAYHSLFLASGDPKDLERCIDSIQQAVAMNPSNPILLFNAGSLTVSASLSDIAGKKISLQTLREGGDFRMLRHFYRDQAQRDALAKTVMDHPGITRALGYVDKVMVISPKSTRPYDVAYRIHSFTDNLAGLRTLEQRLASADVDTSDDFVQMRDFLSGKNDAKSITAATSRLNRMRELAPALKAAGGIPYAYVLCGQVEMLLTLESLGKPTATPDEIVSLADTAFAASNSAATQSARAAAYQFRALQTLRKTEPPVQQMLARAGKFTSTPTMLALILGNADIAKRAASLPDIKSIIEFGRQDLELFPRHQQPGDWALLRNLDPATAQKIADRIRADETMEARQKASLLLNPASPSDAIEAAWYYEIRGQPAKGKEILTKLEKLGIPSLQMP